MENLKDSSLPAPEIFALRESADSESRFGSIEKNNSMANKAKMTKEWQKSINHQPVRKLFSI